MALGGEADTAFNRRNSQIQSPCGMTDRDHIAAFGSISHVSGRVHSLTVYSTYVFAVWCSCRLLSSSRSSTSSIICTFRVLGPSFVDDTQLPEMTLNAYEVSEASRAVVPIVAAF